MTKRERVRLREREIMILQTPPEDEELNEIARLADAACLHDGDPHWSDRVDYFKENPEEEVYYNADPEGREYLRAHIWVDDTGNLPILAIANEKFSSEERWRTYEESLLRYVGKMSPFTTMRLLAEIHRLRKLQTRQDPWDRSYRRPTIELKEAAEEMREITQWKESIWKKFEDHRLKVRKEHEKHGVRLRILAAASFWTRLRWALAFVFLRRIE